MSLTSADPHTSGKQNPFRHAGSSDNLEPTNAGIRNAAGGNSIAEEPLQTMSTGNRNTQTPEASAPAKATWGPLQTAAGLPSTQGNQCQADVLRPAAKLFSSGGHEVMSVVQDDDSTSCVEQHTTSATPYDELD